MMMPPLPTTDLEHVLRHTGTLWEDLRGKRIFLTGGTGFVGTWLLESLLHANDRLDLGMSVVMLTRDADRYRSNWPHLAGHAALRLLQGHVTDFDWPAGSFAFVIHAATAEWHAADAGRPLGTFDTDVAGTRRVLEFARTHGVERLLFTSSGAAYGRQPPHVSHVAEDYAGAPATTDPGSAYGQAKRVSEYMCSMYGEAYGFDATIARLFAFVGPLLPLDANFAVGNFIRDAMSGGPVRISGDGTPFRSYLYAADLAIWLWTILLRGKTAHPYNVGSQAALTIADLARTVIDAIAPSVPVVIAVPPTPGAPAPRYVPDVSRAEQELGLRPLVPLDEAVRRTAAWHAAKAVS
jgi:dTDP-glucose 4,6-dehydratase